MSTTKHIGHVGALAVAVMATVIPAESTVSPAVNLSASIAPCTRTDVTCALIMGFTSLPTPDDAYANAVKNQFIAPTHPGQTIEPVAVTTPEEGWPLTGIIRLGCAAVGAPSLCGPGGAAWPDEPWWKLSGLLDLTYDQSIQADDVSDAKVQQWHAAPCRKSSGSLGVRIAQTGSEEHRAARRSAEIASPCMRDGSESATRPPRVPSLSEAVVQINSPAAPSRCAEAGQP